MINLNDNLNEEISLIKRYVDAWERYSYNLSYKTENYQETNALSKELLELESLIKNNVFPFFMYVSVLNINNNMLWYLSNDIWVYEPEIWQKMLLKHYEKDKVKNFIDKYWLENWDSLLVDLKDQNQEKIERYNKWKIENLEEYEKIMLELNKIIENY